MASKSPGVGWVGQQSHSTKHSTVSCQRWVYYLLHLYKKHLEKRRQFILTFSCMYELKGAVWKHMVTVRWNAAAVISDANVVTSLMGMWSHVQHAHVVQLRCVIYHWLLKSFLFNNANEHPVSFIASIQVVLSYTLRVAFTPTVLPCLMSHLGVHQKNTPRPPKRV